MSLVEKLKRDMIDAMKKKEKDRLTVIRMVKASLDKERIDKKIEITDEVLIDVVGKQVKLRKDAIEEFKKASRTDLVEKTEQELAILKDYLPEQLNEEEVIHMIEEIVEKINAETMKDMGRVMKEITPKVKDRFDMKKVSEIIKERLN